jgi:hypothetical protein
MDRGTADCIGAHTATTLNLLTLVYLSHPSFKAPSSEYGEFVSKIKIFQPDLLSQQTQYLWDLSAAQEAVLFNFIVQLKRESSVFLYQGTC